VRINILRVTYKNFRVNNFGKKGFKKIPVYGRDLCGVFVFIFLGFKSVHRKPRRSFGEFKLRRVVRCKFLPPREECVNYTKLSRLKERPYFEVFRE